MTITDGARLDLKTVMLVVSGVLAVAGSMARAEIAMVRMDAALRAEVSIVRNDLEKASASSNNVQDARISATEGELRNIRLTVCAIARKTGSGSVGCGGGGGD